MAGEDYVHLGQAFTLLIEVRQCRVLAPNQAAAGRPFSASAGRGRGFLAGGRLPFGTSSSMSCALPKRAPAQVRIAARSWFERTV